MPDPRHGRPSASGFKRYRHCRASWQMEREAIRRNMVPPDGPDAASGTRIARWLQTKDDADWEALSLDEQTTADIIDGQEKGVIAQWLGESDAPVFHREFRLGLTEMGRVIRVDDNTNAALLYTGQPDLLVIDGKRGLLIDDKSGRLKVPDAAGNEQLMALAPLVAEYFGLDSIRAVIVQPLCGPPTQADYDGRALVAAWNYNEDLVSGLGEAALDETTPGDWCQYCPARAICPAFIDAATSAPEALQISTLPADPESARSALTARALDLPAVDLGRLLKGRRLIGWYLSAIEAAARMRLERGESVPGWELRERNGRRKIEDASAAANLVAPLLVNAEGGSSAALLRCATLKPRALQDEIHKASGKKSRTRYNMTGEEAKRALAEKLGPLMTAKSSRVLVETGAAIEEEGGDDE